MGIQEWIIKPRMVWIKYFYPYGIFKTVIDMEIFQFCNVLGNSSIDFLMMRNVSKTS